MSAVEVVTNFREFSSLTADEIDWEFEQKIESEETRKNGEKEKDGEGNAKEVKRGEEGKGGEERGEERRGKPWDSLDWHNEEGGDVVRRFLQASEVGDIEYFVCEKEKERERETAFDS